MLRVRRPTALELAGVASRQAAAALTYNAHGSTITGDLPAGYVHDDVSVLLGYGRETFAAAREAVDAAHTRSGIVVSHGAAVVEGNTVALAAALPVGFTLAVCRIVRGVDEPDRYGFAYGTLPLHPEEGKEAFLVERGNDGEVCFRSAPSPSRVAGRLEQHGRSAGACR